MSIKPETKWAIAYDTCASSGIYNGTYSSRKNAIADHVHALADIPRSVFDRALTPEQKKAWDERKKAGDFVVKVRLTVIK